MYRGFMNACRHVASMTLTGVPTGHAAGAAQVGRALAPLHTGCGWRVAQPAWHGLWGASAILSMHQHQQHDCRRRQQQQQQQQLSLGPLRRSVAALASGFASASDIAAAVLAAPTAAALQNLAASAASTPHQAWLLQQYKAQLLSALEEQPPEQLVKALQFFARLGAGHADLFEQAAPVLYNQLGQLAPPDLIALLSAHAAVASQPGGGAAYSQELFAALTEFLWEGLPQLEPRALAEVAAAYAAVDHYDDDEDFFNGLVAAALSQLPAFCPEDLSRLVSSLARLRFAAHELNTAALAQMSAQLEAWSVSSIGLLLQGLAAVQTPADPCELERVAVHVGNSLRNLRTSTDGKQLLTSMAAVRPGAVASAAAGSGSKGAADHAAAAAAAAATAGHAVPGTLPGLAGAGLSHGSSRLGPAWQGFGMTRSSSTDSSSSSSSTDSSDSSNTNGSSHGTNGSSSSSTAAAASIWAAANSSSSMFDYAEAAAPPEPATTSSPPPAAPASSPPSTPSSAAAAAAAAADGAELGPGYVTVTSVGVDGSITKTYIKQARTNSGSASGGSASATAAAAAAASGGGAKVPQRSRGVGSNGRAWQPVRGLGSSFRGGAADSSSASSLSVDACPASWEWQSISSDCRPVYDDAASLAGGLVSLLWAFAMLGHVHTTMAKEALKALSLMQAGGLSCEQLAMLWAAHMRYQQLGHVVLDPNPLLAESYAVFSRELSRAAPRAIVLPNHLQPLAAASWLLAAMRQAPEYQCFPRFMHHHPAHGHAEQREQQALLQQQQQPRFSSWKYRNPAVLSTAGLEASVRGVLAGMGVHVSEPEVTLDGLERVGMHCKHNGVNVAWQVLPPAWCARNPPHGPTAEAQAHRWALQYRGYTVLQVPFHAWSELLESGDRMVQAGYLQRMLDGVTSVRAPNVPTF